MKDAVFSHCKLYTDMEISHWHPALWTSIHVNKNSVIYNNI